MSVITAGSTPSLPKGPVMASKYHLPHDAPEHDRLEEQSDAIIAVMGGQVIHAPLPSSIDRAIDVGCGTAATTVFLGRRFPTASVYGIDLNEVPTLHPKPANVSYIKGDVLELANRDERLQHGTLDYVYSRLIPLGMDNWTGYIGTAYCLLKPEAWVEIQELDFVFHNKNSQPIDGNWKWLREVRRVAQEKGLDMNSGSHSTSYLQQAGFENVRTMEYVWPLGRWRDHPEGDLMAKHSADTWPDIFAHLTQAMLEKTHTEEEIRPLIEELRRTLVPGEEGIHMKFFVTLGRKPQ
ncbi:MAG: hypothetical protein M1822_003701 [Bathelium mastoideum]|nr:MAG: hypothetical protein M1822_003701 [Bathelium mastoideum]